VTRRKFRCDFPHETLLLYPTFETRRATLVRESQPGPSYVGAARGRAGRVGATGRSRCCTLFTLPAPVATSPTALLGVSAPGADGGDPFNDADPAAAVDALSPFYRVDRADYADKVSAGAAPNRSAREWLLGAPYAPIPPAGGTRSRSSERKVQRASGRRGSSCPNANSPSRGLPCSFDASDVRARLPRKGILAHSREKEATGPGRFLSAPSGSAGSGRACLSGSTLSVCPVRHRPATARQSFGAPALSAGTSGPRRIVGWRGPVGEGKGKSRARQSSRRGGGEAGMPPPAAESSISSGPAGFGFRVGRP